MEQPGYFGAALAFAAAEAHLVGVGVDGDGLRTDELSRLLRARRAALRGDPVTAAQELRGAAAAGYDRFMDVRGDPDFASVVRHPEFDAVLRAQRHFRQQAPNRPQQELPLRDAYKALGVEPDATDKEIKTAYRRLMNQHHPDKLVAKGMPESMLEVAKERTREINAAYDLIKERRGIK